MIDSHDTTMATSSYDGSIIIWSLDKYRSLTKKHQLRVNKVEEANLYDMVYMSYSHGLGVIDSTRRLSLIDLDSLSITHAIEAAYDGQLTVLTYNN